MVKLAIIGMGVVGRSILKIINENFEIYKKQFGVECTFTEIYEYDGALINPAGIDLSEVINAKNIRELPYWKEGVKGKDNIPNSESEIVIEVTPVNPNTGEPALSHIMVSLNSGKHIVTSNKGPFYLKYSEIKQAAEANNVEFGFESTVGSCVPLLSTKETLAGNRVKKIAAVLNGTSNYIMSRMGNEGISFDLALKEAQDLGYAEADPTLDIEGYDAAGKLVILANHIMGMNKTIKDVKISGITKVNKDMIELAKKEGKLIRHLGIAKENGELEVSLKLIPATASLALEGTLNGVYFETELAGEIILIGRGAGGPEAAAGIISDMLNIAQKYKL